MAGSDLSFFAEEETAEVATTVYDTQNDAIVWIVDDDVWPDGRTQGGLFEIQVGATVPESFSNGDGIDPL